ncbi:two-component sensor histidine kinase [Marinoscillum furvescens DSM 4134]|uniref:Two-component sensor histidine kinase n=2 Tax=Marinoscillum furvescens TaxID=1026 RepID=A0A3D9KWS9_MARFU|nr:two-component sensor histidine kinase [Marinoscillum furvescens DSM 4134]
MYRQVILSVIVMLATACQEATNIKRVNPHLTQSISLLKRGDSFYYRRNYDSAIIFYRQAIHQMVPSDSINMYSNLINDIGLCYKKMGQYDSALHYYRRSEQVDLERSDTLSLAGRWRNIGNVYESLGWHTEAIALYLMASDLLRPHYSYKVGPIHIAIGNIYFDQGEYRQAITEYRKALMLAGGTSSRRKAQVYNNMGLSFLQEGMLDSSRFYLDQSLRHSLLSDSSSLGYTLNSIGELHLKQRNLDSAAHYFSLSQDVSTRQGNGALQARTFCYQAQLALQSGDTRLARDKVFEALAYAERQQAGELLLDCYEVLSDIYFRLADYQRAFGFLKHWSQLNDSLFHNGKLATERVVKEHELDQKETEANRARERAKDAVASAKRNSFLVGVMIIVFIVFLMLFAVIYRQRQRLRRVNQDLVISNEQIDALNRQNFHFTVNSLAGIIGILNSQLPHFKDEEIYDVLLAEKLRIESISILYTKLFGSDDGEHVKAAPFLVEVVENTLDAYGLGSNKRLISIPNISWDNNQAFAIGLIVNEVSLNAAKYGLSNESKFLLQVTLDRGKQALVMQDDGPGLPDSVDWYETDSFGIRLIRILCKQLKADVQVISEGGLRYEITF